MNILQHKFFSFIVLILIGVFSLVVIYLRMPAQRNFVYGNTLEITQFGLGAYDSEGNILFSLSPLNDYFYQGKAKEHIENKIIKSNNGSFLQKNLVSLKDFIFNKKSLIWDTNGVNSKANSWENFIVNSNQKQIEITRQIDLNKQIMTGVGQSIVICPDCLVTDTSNRVYFNGSFVTNAKLNAATNLGLTPVFVGEGQSLPVDITKIIVFSVDGRRIIEVPIAVKELVFLQDRWHLLEFKSVFAKATRANLSQKIIISN